MNIFRPKRIADNASLQKWLARDHSDVVADSKERAVLQRKLEDKYKLKQGPKAHFFSPGGSYTLHPKN